MLCINEKQLRNLCLTFLLTVTMLFRLPGLLLTHNNNDELIHVALAAKIDKYDWNVFRNQNYNLFYVERLLHRESLLAEVYEGKNAAEGSLLKGFLGEHEALSHHPPGLPFVISVFHFLSLGNHVGFVVNLSSDIYRMLLNAPMQFYTCVVPFLFSILLVLATFMLGELFLSWQVGFLAALFLSFSPVELMTSNKIWADDMTALFLTLAIILFLLSIRNNKPLFSLAAGLSCGAAILTKMIGVYFVITILVFHFLENANKQASLNNLRSFFLDRKVLYFLAGVFIVSAWWFNLYYSQFDIVGANGYFAVNEQWETAKTWNTHFSIVSTRPWYSYLVLVPFQTPFYFFAYFFILFFIARKKILLSFMQFNQERKYFFNFSIVWFFIVSILLMLKPGKELRYMLIAYPTISVLSSYCFFQCNEWLKARSDISSRLRRLVMLSILLLSLVTSLQIGLPRVLVRSDLIPIPL